MKIKGMQPLDWLMIVLIVFMVTRYDFNNMDSFETIDYVLLGCYAVWFIMLFVRLYIENFKNK